MTETESSDSSSSDSRSFQKIGAALVWLAIIAGYVYYSSTSGLGPFEIAEQLRTVLAENWWGPALFVLVYAVRPLVLFPASVLTILAGVAFGLGWGSLWTVVASNLSTAVAFAIGATLLNGKVAERLVKLMGNLVDRARRNPFETAIIARLLYLPFDAVGYAAGFLKIPFGPFMAGSALGTLPGTIAFVGFGASVGSLSDGTPEFDFRVLGASVALAIAGTVLSRYLKRRNPTSKVAI